jgi:hypothetical protein
VKAHVLLVLERMRMINGCRAYTFWLPPMFYLPSSSSLLPYLVRWKFCRMALLPLSHVNGWTAWSDGRQPNEVGLLLCVYRPCFPIYLVLPNPNLPNLKSSSPHQPPGETTRVASDITSKCHCSPLGPRTMGNCEISLLLTFPSPFQVSFRPEIG